MEAHCGALWNRHAIAFVDAEAAMDALKQVLEWPDGAQLGVDALLEPAWREALSAHWLRAVVSDIDANGHTAPVSATQATPLTAHLIQHTDGLPAPESAWRASDCPIEIISDVPTPLPGVGRASILLLSMDPGQMLQGGGLCLLLDADSERAAALRAARTELPATLACALARSQWAQVQHLLARRAQTAMAYARLRHRGLFTLPPVPASGRHWRHFTLAFESTAQRDDFLAFLNRAQIHAAAPPGWALAPDEAALPGVNRWLRHSLRLPIYAALDDAERKRVINRIHRWSERNDNR
ncbi:hypothetical protein MAIT1_01261 [Magnetofaba australis IT-1]|uniref:DegT/DnrJ/EryC1/StrS aminotransferase n=1 Tax=Magnetofaba australis IT-1 TaxID=1434232 RepID=A0A1Y2K7I2_9PROT|nr:hypothetical protein MAIT1_01261 [Magnetofaba australis IT-1]